ncbi:MAG TPA: hypothetical protein VFA22_03900 [Stellaceae bacterium]|nr:hypothetical protein [Stellaceae bacterium]
MARPEEPTLREAVARFDDAEKLEAAVSALQSGGFQRADISFIAREGLLGAHVAGGYGDMRQAADDPHAPHEPPVESTDIRQGRTLTTSLAAVVAAFAAAGFTVATGGTAALAAGIAAAAGLGAGAAGAAVGMKAEAGERNFVDEQLERGGVILWVHTRDAAAEARALEVLRDAGGRDAHLHEPPVAG